MKRTVPRRFLDVRLVSLFIDGKVLQESTASDAETATCLVIRRAIAAGTVYYGNRAVRLWDRSTSRSQYYSALEHIGSVVRMLIDRVEVELDDRSLEAQFDVFNVRTAVARLKVSRLDLVESESIDFHVSSLPLSDILFKLI